MRKMNPTIVRSSTERTLRQMCGTCGSFELSREGWFQSLIISGRYKPPSCCNSIPDPRY
jgi:hypothetical protein